MHGAYDNLAYGDMDTFEMSCQEGLFFFFFVCLKIIYSCTNDKYICEGSMEIIFVNCILNKH